MNFLDYLLLAAVATGVFFALRYLYRRNKQYGCFGCCGDCAHCGQYAKKK